MDSKAWGPLACTSLVPHEMRIVKRQSLEVRDRKVFQ